MKATGVESGRAGMASDVVATRTAARVTPSQGPTFEEVLSSGTQSLIRGATAAVRSLPVSPIVAASVRPGPTDGERTPAAPRESTAWDVAEGAGGARANPSGAGDSDAGLESALSRSQDMNLYFLQIQEQMAAENRAYTAYSNVLKARHETIKNAISNIR